MAALVPNVEQRIPKAARPVVVVELYEHLPSSTDKRLPYSGMPQLVGFKRYTASPV
jgi:hypothetical protein